MIRQTAKHEEKFHVSLNADNYECTKTGSNCIFDNVHSIVV